MPTDTHQGSILLVDDMPENLTVLSQILNEHGYTVRPAINGHLALNAVEAMLPDLILLDIRMPGMNGFEVCRRLKANELTQRIPVIFISAVNELPEKVKAFEVGGVDYILKPFQEKEVLARVKTHLKLRDMDRQLREQNTQLQEEIRRRTEAEADMRAANSELQRALDNLHHTQDQLIQSEKMAVLGKLAANIGHEINTPLGAIRAAASNITKASQETIRRLPDVIQHITPEQQDLLFALLHRALESNPHLSSREGRTVRRALQQEMDAHHIHQAHRMASLLVYMGIHDDITPFFSLFLSEKGPHIVETAYNLILQHHSGKNIGDAVDRTSKIVFALKNYARRGATGQKTRAHIVEGIEVVLALYHHQFEQGIEVITQYEDVPDIFCYPDELEQVWTNLLFNALQSMQGAGTLEISVQSVKPGQMSKASPAYILVTITDSGPGIPQTIKEQIFDPFFTTKAPGEGSGLGLDICRTIIAKHQGEIKVESQPGRTTFSVWFPVQSTAD